jgi:hypothetical protein
VLEGYRSLVRAALTASIGPQGQGGAEEQRYRRSQRCSTFPMPATEHSSTVTCSTNAWGTVMARVHSSNPLSCATVQCDGGGTCMPFTPCSIMNYAESTSSRRSASLIAHCSSLVVQLSSCCVASRPRPCHHPHPLWVRSLRRTTLRLATRSRVAAPQWGAIHLGTARDCAMSRTRSRARSPGAQAPHSRDTGRWSRS